jgi:hypothetical protein
METFWSQQIARSHETSSYGEKEPADCAVEAEGLRRSMENKMSFEVGDYVYLKVSLMRGLRSFKL